MSVVVGAGLVIVAAFIVAALSGAIRRWAPTQLRVVETAVDVASFSAMWAIGAGVVAVLLKYLTGMHVAWRPALIGGGMTFLAINIGNRLFGVYLSRFGATSVAGAAGSVMVGLVWLYVIAQIVLAGAELTRAIQRSGGPGQVAIEGPVDDGTSED